VLFRSPQNPKTPYLSQMTMNKTYWDKLYYNKVEVSEL
jgi:hypothetical protein